MHQIANGLNRLFRRINPKTPLKATLYQILCLDYFFFSFWMATRPDVPYGLFLLITIPFFALSQGYRFKAYGLMSNGAIKLVKIKNEEEKTEVKKLQEYKKTKEAMNLFEHSPESPYSNSIELYDAIPKYYWGNQIRKDGKYLEPLQRNFVFHKKKYNVTITPATIECEDGVFRHFYPSQREELVEDALRKLACNGNGCFLDDEAAVTFTLYQLREELKERGHGYDISDLKDALFINQDANMSLETIDGKIIVKSHIFETVGLTTLEDWKGLGKKTSCYVRFNPLVTRCIKDKSFRQLNYLTCMEYQKALARWLHKRLSHVYTQAGWDHQYTIFLSTIIQDSGIKQYPRITDNLREVRGALNELILKETICKFEEEMVYGSPKNKIVDVKFILFSHATFTKFMKEANKKAKDIFISAS